MKLLRYLNPFLIRDAVRTTHRVIGEGGPRAVRLARVGEPEGWILPSSTVEIDVVGRRHGRIERLRPEVPVPLLWALTWRVARRLLA